MAIPLVLLSSLLFYKITYARPRLRSVLRFFRATFLDGQWHDISVARGRRSEREFYTDNLMGLLASLVAKNTAIIVYAAYEYARKCPSVR